jgi:hypothetical protein
MLKGNSKVEKLNYSGAAERAEAATRWSAPTHEAKVGCARKLL